MPASGSFAPRFDIDTSPEDEVQQRKHRSRRWARKDAPLLNFPSQSASGISFKSQALYLVVYITRYLGG